MAEAKTRPTDADVTKFLDAVPDETKRADARRILEIMRAATGQQAKMWGPSIVGFGSYHYKYESGREGDAPTVGFSPRKQNFALYLTGLLEENPKELAALGKFKTGKGCLYLNRLSDVDPAVLKKLVKIAYDLTKKRHGAT